MSLRCNYFPKFNVCMYFLFSLYESIFLNLYEYAQYHEFHIKIILFFNVDVKMKNQ